MFKEGCFNDYTLAYFITGGTKEWQELAWNYLLKRGMQSIRCPFLMDILRWGPKEYEKEVWVWLKNHAGFKDYLFLWPENFSWKYKILGFTHLFLSWCKRKLGAK